MVDVIDKKAALRRYFPRPFYLLQETGGQGLEVILDAVGDQLNTAAAEIANARAQYLLATAEGVYLQVHGVNVDILRPQGFNMTDDRFRQLIEIITNTPKNIEQIFERLIALFFGPNAISSGIVDVYSYRNKEIICEVSENALIIASSRTLLGTTYLHESSADPYTGNPQASWSTTLAAPAAATDTSVTLSSAAGVPAYGIAEFSAQTLCKVFTLNGSVLTFPAPFGAAYPAGAPVTGPMTPDNYPSGYVYQSELAVDILTGFAAGATSASIGTLPQGFPSEGTVYMGDPTANTNFEAKGFSISGNTMLFDGPTTYGHSSGDTATIPCLLRSIKTTLAQNIAAGTSVGGSGALAVASSANFPLVRQAIILDNGGNVPEIVPFTTRQVGNNSAIIIDPNYVFLNDHVSGERVNLMARQTAPRTSGLDYPFFINDTSSLRNAFLNLLLRVKVTGCKLVFVVT